MKKAKPFVKAKTRQTKDDHVARAWAIQQRIIQAAASSSEAPEDPACNKLTRELLAAKS